MLFMASMLAWFMLGLGCSYIGKALDWSDGMILLSFIMVYVAIQLIAEAGPKDEA